MKTSLLPALLCGCLVSACVPGRELVSPAVEGMVVDARTRRPLPGASVVLLYDQPRREGAVYEAPTQLAAGVTNAGGRASLAAQYKFGTVMIYGDWLPSKFTIRVQKTGYRPATLDKAYSLTVSPHQPITLNIALTPDADRR